MRALPKPQGQVPHPHAWIWEPLAENPTFLLRPMFGSKAAYLEGKIIACFCTRGEPWQGMLVSTERAHHPSLRAEFPELAPHPILTKWLYLPEASEGFERVAERIVRLALRCDPRIAWYHPRKSGDGQAMLSPTRALLDFGPGRTELAPMK